MPIVICWSLSVFLAWLLIFLRRNTAEVSSNFFNWLFLLLFAFQSLAITPYLLYIFRFHSAWSTFYLFNPEQFPLIKTQQLLLSVLIVLAGYLLFIVSYAYSRLTWNSGHYVAFNLPWLLAGGAITFCGINYFDRFGLVSDFAAFWEHSGTVLYHSPVLYAFAAVFLLLILTIRLSFKVK